MQDEWLDWIARNPWLFENDGQPPRVGPDQGMPLGPPDPRQRRRQGVETMNVDNAHHRTWSSSNWDESFIDYLQNGPTRQGGMR